MKNLKGGGPRRMTHQSVSRGGGARVAHVWVAAKVCGPRACVRDSMRGSRACVYVSVLVAVCGRLRACGWLYACMWVHGCGWLWVGECPTPAPDVHTSLSASSSKRQPTPHHRHRGTHQQRVHSRGGACDTTHARGHGHGTVDTLQLDALHWQEAPSVQHVLGKQKG